MTDLDLPALPDRIAAVYARGAGPWREALAVLDTPLMPRWRLREHRSAPGKTGCRLCARRPPRPTDASVDDCDLDPPDQLFVMPGGFDTYCREHYAAHWARLLETTV